MTDTEHLWEAAEKLLLLVQDEARRESSKYELGEDRKEDLGPFDTKGRLIFCFLTLTSSILAGWLCL